MNLEQLQFIGYIVLWLTFIAGVFVLSAGLNEDRESKVIVGIVLLAPNILVTAWMALDGLVHYYVSLGSP